MPIYKCDGEKKDGLQKYIVRVSYVSDCGKYKKLTRTAYGLEDAKRVELALSEEKTNSKIQEKDSKHNSKMTVQELYDRFTEFKQYEMRGTTLGNYESNFRLHINPIIGPVPIGKLTVEVLENWKLYVEKLDFNISYRKAIYNSLRAVLYFAVKRKYIKENPLLSVGNFKEPLQIKEEIQFYTLDDFSKYINEVRKSALEDEVKNNVSNWDYYVFFNIAFYTGLRKGEIYALKWSDIRGDRLSVTRSYNQSATKENKVETATKNKASIRTIQLSKLLIKLLAEHKERHKNLPHFSDEFRICGGDDFLSDSSTRKMLQKCSKSTGLSKIKIHSFRHSHASLLANAGISIHEISRRLGHANIEMTLNTYSHLYPGKRKGQ